MLPIQTNHPGHSLIRIENLCKSYNLLDANGKILAAVLPEIQSIKTVYLKDVKPKKKITI